MPTPNFLETSALVAVLDHKSFTKAAEQLGLSPARVSELVRKLEDRVGVRLVERTTRSVAATQAGERLLERLRPLLNDYQAALNSLNDFRGRPAGTLRLTVPPPAADFVLAPVIADFCLDIPEISLDVSIDRAFVDIVDGAFRRGNTAWRARRARYDRACASATKCRSPGSVTAIWRGMAHRGLRQELTRHACIRVPPTRAALWCRGASASSVECWRFRSRVLSPSMKPGIAIKAAIHGVGLVQLPLPYLAPELAAGRLVTVLADWMQPRVDAFFLYYSSRRQIRPPLKAFADFLRDAYYRGTRK